MPAPKRRITWEVVRKSDLRSKPGVKSEATSVFRASCRVTSESPSVLSPALKEVEWCDRVVRSIRPTMSVVEMPSVRGIVRYLPIGT